MSRNVAYNCIHDVNAINALRIADSDVLAQVRYHTENIASYHAC